MTADKSNKHDASEQEQTRIVCSFLYTYLHYKRMKHRQGCHVLLKQYANQSINQSINTIMVCSHWAFNATYYKAMNRRTICLFNTSKTPSRLHGTSHIWHFMKTIVICFEVKHIWLLKTGLYVSDRITITKTLKTTSVLWYLACDTL